MDLKNRAKQLKLDIPAVFIALRKKETPVIAKFFAVITVGYALSPIDFILDFIPVITIWVMLVIFVVKLVIVKMF